MTKPTTITIWRNNRLDQEETLQLADLADRFMTSEWADGLMLLERAVAGFMTMDEHATWENRAAFDELCDLITERKQAK